MIRPWILLAMIAGSLGPAVESPPPPPPSRFVGLIGEYGEAKTPLIVFEQGGRLRIQFDKKSSESLEEVSSEIHVFTAPGRLAGKKLTFQRGSNGKAIEVELEGKVSKRRTLDGEDGQTFRVQPTRPVEVIRREIAGLEPPPEAGKKPADLVDLVDFVPGLKLDIRYATTNNFLSTPLYTSARALMQRPAAKALAKVQAGLKPLGLGLLVHDAYRPWKVTKLFWEATPEVFHNFVADPAKGSRHNRGCAVDLTLCDVATGRPIEMVGGYDEFSDRSYPDYPGGTSLQRYHRDLLRKFMEAEGFTVNEAEWWHFDFNGWRDYPIVDLPFEALPKR